MIKKADTESDHRLVRMTARMNKRLARLKTITSKNLPISTQNFKDMKERFETTLTNRSEKFEEVTASNFRGIIKEEATKSAGKTKKKTPVLSKIDQETKQLEDRRKELRKKENKSERERK